MQPSELDSLCEAACKRLQQYINRAAAQHARALRKSFEELRNKAP